MKQVSLIIRQLLDNGLMLPIQEMTPEQELESLVIPDFESFAEEFEMASGEVTDLNISDTELAKDRFGRAHLASLGAEIMPFKKVVVLIGGHSSGKTTLYNLLTGLNLPTDSAENTGTIIECAYARKKEIRVYFKDAPPENFDYTTDMVRRLVDKYTQKREGKVFDKEFSKLRILYPLNTLFKSILLVDTPGINGLEFGTLFEENTFPYLQQLAKQKTKVIWVQNLSRFEPSQQELDIINRLTNHGKSKLFVGTNYDNYLKIGHWDVLFKLLNKAIYDESDGTKKSLKEIFTDNVHITTLAGESLMIRKINDPESEIRHSFSDDLIRKWLHVGIEEAQAIYIRGMSELVDLAKLKKSYCDALVNQEFSVFVRVIKEQFVDKNPIRSCYPITKDIVQRSIGFNENNDKIINLEKFRLNKETLADLTSAIEEACIVFVEGALDAKENEIEHNLDRIGLEISFEKELLLFKLISRTQYRIFLRNQKVEISKILKTQFNRLRRKYSKGKTVRDRSIRREIRENHLSPTRFLFLLDWFDEGYQTSCSAFLKSLEKKVTESLIMR